MHKYQLLRQRADEFLLLLEKYSQIDSDVSDFKNWFMPWYVRIQRREVRLPCYEYRLGAYFQNPDISPLAERYSYVMPRHCLASAATLFSEAIRDWLSDPRYVERLKAVGEEPSAILDELPPPEEELPLAAPVAGAKNGCWVKELVSRWGGK